MHSYLKRCGAQLLRLALARSFVRVAIVTAFLLPAAASVFLRGANYIPSDR